MAFSGTRFVARAAACVLVASVAAPTLLSSSVHAASKAAPVWLVTDAAKKTVTLTVVAAYKGGFDFNGYGKGALTVTVPVGYSVNVVFSNMSAMPHSVSFTSYDKRTSVSDFPLAFSGATSPNPKAGIGKGVTQKFSFVASKAGTYAMVCAVPGHSLGGMWDTFKVVPSGAASISPKM